MLIKFQSNPAVTLRGNRINVMDFGTRVCYTARSRAQTADGGCDLIGLIFNLRGPPVADNSGVRIADRVRRSMSNPREREPSGRDS